jgi:GGDEF domain-containing protein
MEAGLESTARRIGYRGARRLLLAAGVAVLLITVAVMYVRRVETVEVMATVLFLPVFVALVFWNVRGGLLVGILAAAAYAALRYPAIDAVGADRFLGLIASRAVAYIAFGALGGWASRQLETSLEKLELYDQIDDVTGIFNARFFVQDIDLEMSRSKRYQTIFSVSIVDVPASAFEPLDGKQRKRALRDLGRILKDSVRTVDRAVHAQDRDRHRFAVVLPETGPEGVRVFTERFVERVSEFLSQRGARVTPDTVNSVAATFPEDEAVIQGLRNQFSAIDRVDHPEASESGVGGA